MPVYSLEGKQTSEMDAGGVFSMPVRFEIINRCFLAEKSLLRHPYGTDYFAGKRTSAHYHGERGIRHSMMNKEMARLRRIHGTGYLHMTARFSPQAIKGRAAHPPKPEKIWRLKVNKREKILGLVSSLSAASNRAFISNHGYLLPQNFPSFPIIVEDTLQEIKTAKQLKSILTAFGLKDEMERVSYKKIRAGKGKSRGRRYKKKTGPLIVVKEDKGISKAANNLPGFGFSVANKLDVSMLAPGGQPGRLIIISKSAAEELSNLIKWKR